MAHDTMASVEHTEISKQVLENVHRRQLTNGESNSVHHEAIIEALGGIDEILQHLFASNVVLEQQQLDSLHHIITNTSHKDQQTTTIDAVSQLQSQQDEAYHHTFSYTFKDEDSLLFTIFGQENGSKILHVLNGRIMKGILFSLLGVFIILCSSLFYGLSWDAFFACASFLFLLASIYITVWILYSNKEAIKLLLKQFEFWFKLFYLFQYLVANAIIAYILFDHPPHFICAYTLFLAALLCIVMIFDTINTKKSIKLMISSFAVAVFAWRSLQIMLDTYYEYEVFNGVVVTIDIPYMNDQASEIRISIVDTCSNAAQILTIFLLKQLISMIRKPNQALVIKTKPFIVYENNKQTVPTIKKLKHWRRATTVSWGMFLLLCIVFIVNVENFSLVVGYLPTIINVGSITLIIIFVFIVTVTIVFLIVANSKFHWMINIFVFLLMIIYVVAVFLYRFLAIGLFMLLILFGLSATYTLKVSEMEKMKQEKERNGSNEDAKREDQRAESHENCTDIVYMR
eukprot:524453_1